MPRRKLSKWWERDDGNNTEWQELKTPEGLTYFYNTRTQVTQWERPNELKTEADYQMEGEWVWMPDDSEAYVPAKVVSRAGKKINLQTEDGRTHQIKATTKLSPLSWSSLQRVVSDLTLLDNIEAPLILHNLRKRFEQDKIYTNLGTILISINPFFRLPLYGPEVISDYLEKGTREMPPHVFNIADSALRGVKDGYNDQSIIVSGESGAGKTESTKQCLSYLASNSDSTSGVEEKILLSNPILEAFGNAKTIRNNNSSRFGKFIEIFFDASQNICGSKTRNFLLEKVRVVQQAKTERNFHVFYQLTKAADASLRESLGLGHSSDYLFLSESQCIDVEGIDDIHDFQEMKDAMSALDFSEDEKLYIFQTLSAILHLGNVQFTTSGDRQCTIDDLFPLQWAAGLLQVYPESLQDVLLTRVLRIRGQGETVVGLGREEAYEARNALAKFIYGNMFDWIVQKVNQSMALAQVDSRNCSIGILDIFGFEIFEWNSFEQFCINYTNEKLQQFFNANTFKLEEQLYASEGITFKHVEFIDNQPVLDMVEGKSPPGMMRLLDEQVVVPKGSDIKFVGLCFEQHKENRLLKQGKKKQLFVISHYAGDVVYDSVGFLDKNRDTLTQDALEMLHSSVFPFIPQIFTNLQSVSSMERKRTLGSQFRKQLEDLMRQLYETEPHYIRCVKPNDNKQPKQFIAKNVYEQLMYSGVFEATKIRKTGFPFRQPHKVFVERYSVIDHQTQYSMDRRGAESLVRALHLNADNVRMGKTMVLYRAEEFKAMELQRSIVIQKVEIVNELNEMMSRLPSSTDFDNADRFYEKLSRVCKRAKLFNVSDPVIEEAKRLIYEFLESRIDPETKALLEQAKQSLDRALLQQACDAADVYGYDTSLCKQCHRLLKRIVRIDEETDKAYYTLNEKHMGAVLNAADDLGYSNDYIEYFRELLHHTSQQQLLKVLITRAKELKDFARAIRLTIRIKDSIFAQQRHMFSLRNCGLLKSPLEWSNAKRLSMSREKLRDSMMRHTLESIHSPLTNVVDPAVSKQAIGILKSIQGFMIDRKCSDPLAEGESIVKLGLRQPLLRDEIYCQIIKQVTNNPSQASKKRGWELLGACIAIFPPSEGFENYLEVYLTDHAGSPDYVGALQNVAYYGAKDTLINRSMFSRIPQLLKERTDEYAERLPEGVPSYADLEDPFSQTFDSGLDFQFHRKGPQPSQKKELKERVSMRDAFVPPEASGWKEYLDDASGDVYYYNENTGESTWDCPAELKYAMTTAPGIRI